MRLEEAECRRLFGRSPKAVLATIGPNGPHVVPIVFALVGDTIVTAVDHKPKSTRRLRRLANIAHDPHVAVLVDHYEADWQRLWWVRADGEASVTDDRGGVEEAARTLVFRHEQYAGHPPEGPVIRIEVLRWTGWTAAPTR